MHSQIYAELVHRHCYPEYLREAAAHREGRRAAGQPAGASPAAAGFLRASFRLVQRAGGRPAGR